MLYLFLNFWLILVFIFCFIGMMKDLYFCINQLGIIYYGLGRYLMEMYYIQCVFYVCNKDVKSSFFFNMLRFRENVYLFDLQYIDIFKIRFKWNIFSIRLNMREEICMGVYDGEFLGF